MSHRHSLALTAALIAAVAAPATIASAHTPSQPTVRVLNTTALDGLGAGSTIGPDGALYVPNSIEGTLVRIDPVTGAERIVGRGLPLPNGGFGAWDTAFVGNTAYVLVTLAGADIGQDAVMGIYRLGKHGTFSVFADIGSWAADHPPADADWFLPQGSSTRWRPGVTASSSPMPTSPRCTASTGTDR